MYGICSENSSFVEGSHYFFAKKRKLKAIFISHVACSFGDDDAQLFDNFI